MSGSHWLGWDVRPCFECRKPEGQEKRLNLVNYPGWGTVRVCSPCLEDLYEKDPEWHSQVRPACDACHGTGRYDDVMRCGTCDGEGTLEW